MFLLNEQEAPCKSNRTRDSRIPCNPLDEPQVLLRAINQVNQQVIESGSNYGRRKRIAYETIVIANHGNRSREHDWWFRTGTSVCTPLRYATRRTNAETTRGCTGSGSYRVHAHESSNINTVWEERPLNNLKHEWRDRDEGDQAFFETAASMRVSRCCSYLSCQWLSLEMPVGFTTSQPIVNGEQAFQNGKNKKRVWISSIRNRQRRGVCVGWQVGRRCQQQFGNQRMRHKPTGGRNIMYQ